MYSYDLPLPSGEGRLERVVTAEALLTLGYDEVSKRLTSQERQDAQGVHTLSLGYDGPMLSSVSWSGSAGLTAGTVSMGYDDDFRVQALTVSGTPSVSYGYDADGLLTSVGAQSLSRDAGHGLLTGTVLQELSTAVGVNEFGELSSYTVSHSGTAGVVYTESVSARDAAGRIVSVSEGVLDEQGTLAAQAREYDYDGAGRLVQVLSGGQPSGAYSYDENGNRTSHTSEAGTVVGRYDGQDRLTRYCPEDGQGEAAPDGVQPCFTYSYRASGELRTKQELEPGGAPGAVTTYDYDEQGALRSVELADGRLVQYELDPQGRRVGKWVDGLKQWGLLYKDALEPVAELDAEGNVVSVFVYGSKAHVPDYMVKGGVTYRVVSDHLGSVRAVVDATTGAVVQRVGYDEFGKVLADSNPGFQPFGFAGGLYDADTGLTRFGARDYDPVVGRWTAKDPILFDGGQANLYVYVGNDPVNNIDPEGLGPLDWVAKRLCKRLGIYCPVKPGKCFVEYETCMADAQTCNSDSERTERQAYCVKKKASCDTGLPAPTEPPKRRRGTQCRAIDCPE